MDWTEKSEQKKRIRKMAGRMLWADFKATVCSWKILLLSLLTILFIVLAFVRSIENYNVGAGYYFVTWVVISLSAMYESVFNYLPLASGDVRYYLKYRTNLLTAWTVVLYVAIALMLQLFGVELFVERGVSSLIMMLTTYELMLQLTLFEHTEGKGKLLDANLPTSRKVRFCIYFAYDFILMIISMIYTMFMEDAEKAKLWIVILAAAYVVMYIFRADLSTWFKHEEYKKPGRRTMYTTQAQLDAQQQN